MKNYLLVTIIFLCSSFLFSAPGDLMWRYQTGNSTDSSPCVFDGVVYIGSSDTYLYAINCSDGTLKWRYQTGGYVWSSPCVIDGVTYVGSHDNYLYAINTSNGTLKWRYNTGNYLNLTSPCVSDEIVYIGSCYYGYVYAINTSDGSLKWRYQTGGSMDSSPCVSNGVVYIGNGDCYFYAINSSDGTLKWRYRTGDYIKSSPCAADGAVYFGSTDWYFYALYSANGALLWRYQAGYPIHSSPCILEGILYFGSVDQWLYALNADNGNLQWKCHPGVCIYNSPCISDGIIYIGTIDNYLYALQAGTVQVVAPNGGESWYCNANNNITWNATSIDSVRIYYSTDAGSNWTSIGTCADQSSGNGTYSWKIPWMETTSQARVRVTNYLGNLSDNSDANFTINTGSLTVTSPDGGEVWYSGDTHPVRWTASSNLDSVHIEYSTNNGSSYISIARVANQSPYNWKIPNTPSTQCLVRITNTGYSKPTDVSNGVFEIRRGTGFEKATYENSIPLIFNVSPNPFSNRLTITVPSSASIYDITGRMIARLDKGKYTLDTSKWKQGVYIVKSGKEMKKVMKLD